MTAEQVPRPYTTIPDYLNRQPSELVAPGGSLEHSERFTSIVRMATSLMMSDIVIGDRDVELYASVGPAVVVPTHRSWTDLTAISEIGHRSGEGQPYFLSKRENMDSRLTATFFGKMRTFPIDRDMDDPRWRTMFMKWAKFVLTEEEMKLVIFGEGTRKSGPIVEDMFDGPLVAAKKNKRPILPVGIWGTETVNYLKRRPRTVVTVGDPYVVVSLRDKEVMIEKVQAQFDRARLLAERLAVK